MVWDRRISHEAYTSLYNTQIKISSTINGLRDEIKAFNGRITKLEKLLENKEDLKMYLNESDYIYDDEWRENEWKAKEATFLNNMGIALQGYINSEYYNKLSKSNKELINNFYNYASFTNADIFTELITKCTTKTQSVIDNRNKKNIKY